MAFASCADRPAASASERWNRGQVSGALAAQKRLGPLGVAARETAERARAVSVRKGNELEEARARATARDAADERAEEVAPD